MDSRRLITLRSDIISHCIVWAREQIAAGRLCNRFTSRNAETNVRLQATAKMSECAFAQWAGLDPMKAVNFRGGDDGGDVLVGKTMVDIKSCEMFKWLLIWPASKVAEYPKKRFDALVLVKHDLPDFMIARWITKDRFWQEKLTATSTSIPQLTPGTLYMRESSMDSMASFPMSIAGEVRG